MERRRFFRSLVGRSASVALVAATVPVVDAEPITQALSHTNPACPSCLCLFTTPQPVDPRESRMAWADRLTRPIDITCSYCHWVGTVTFYRKVGD